MYLRMNKNDWSNYNEYNDYSYGGNQTIFAPWPTITVYQNSTLAWGTEPGSSGSTPPPTSTSSLVPSTQTQTSSSVPPTSTRTNTPLPPTFTRTNTPKATNTPTPVPPTPTKTLASSTPIKSATSTPSSTPGSGGTCAVSYVNQNDWGSGFAANVTITNNSTNAINGWTLTWSFPGNQTITSIWNGVFTQTGTSVSVTNASYNAIIGASGGTVSFGFNANYSGTNNNPASFLLNGGTCH